VLDVIIGFLNSAEALGMNPCDVAGAAPEYLKHASERKRIIVLSKLRDDLLAQGVSIGWDSGCGTIMRQPSKWDAFEKTHDFSVNLPLIGVDGFVARVSFIKYADGSWAVGQNATERVLHRHIPPCRAVVTTIKGDTSSAISERSGSKMPSGAIVGVHPTPGANFGSSGVAK
jgi:hypothetical protein